MIKYNDTYKGEVFFGLDMVQILKIHLNDKHSANRNDQLKIKDRKTFRKT